MVVDYAAALEAVKVVVQNHEGRNTVVSSIICGTITGVSCFGACLLLGPLGVFAGAAIGSTVAYKTHKNRFKSLLQVIEEDFSEEERMELMEKVDRFRSQLHPSDSIQFIVLLKGDLNVSLTLFNLVRLCINNIAEKRKHAN